MTQLNARKNLHQSQSNVPETTWLQGTKVGRYHVPGYAPPSIRTF